MTNWDDTPADQSRFIFYGTHQIAFPGHTYHETLIGVDPNHPMLSILKKAKDQGDFVVLSGIPKEKGPLPPPKSEAEKKHRESQENIRLQETWAHSARYNTGVLARVSGFVPLSGNSYKLEFEPIDRVYFQQIYDRGEWYEADIFPRVMRAETELPAETEALMGRLRKQAVDLAKIVNFNQFAYKMELEEDVKSFRDNGEEPDPELLKELAAVKKTSAIKMIGEIERIKDPEELIEFLIGSMHAKDKERNIIWAPPEHRQELLEKDNIHDRLLKLMDMVTFTIQMRTTADNDIGNDIERYRNMAAKKARVSQELGELLQVIQENNYHDVLEAHMERMPKGKGKGEDSNLDPALAKLKAKLEAKDLSPEMREAVDDAFKTIAKNPYSPETPKLEEYLKRISRIPFGEKDMSPIINDLAAAKKSLDDHHYGQYEAKEAILDSLAAQIKSGVANGKIICLVGAPGVGKTGLYEAIAEASGRKFIKLALGGVKDESLLRGHSRTYVDSKPGFIIESMMKCGTSNPLMCLDEIDKCDPDKIVPVMLEILDPEQNKEFRDHYLGQPYDLSKVMFVASANDLSQVHPALLSRMEIIQVPSYLPQEKLIIGKNYMLPKAAKEAGVHVEISDEAMAELISHTQEAGVRKLKQKLDRFCAKVARAILDKDVPDTTAEAPFKAHNAADIEKYLGKPTSEPDKCHDEPQVGDVTGLAWTSSGGVLMRTQATMWEEEGAGGFRLTANGNIMNVMKESVQAVDIFLRGHAEKLGIDPKVMRNQHLHLFFTEVGIPKDGPSAGVTMAIAGISVLTNTKVRHDIAMTGEIDIRGNVTSVGGIREKVMAAVDAGCTKVLLPWPNRHDVEKFPQDLKDYLAQKGVSIVPVKTVFEAMEHALVKTPGLDKVLTPEKIPLGFIPANINKPDVNEGSEQHAAPAMQPGGPG